METYFALILYLLVLLLFNSYVAYPVIIKLFSLFYQSSPIDNNSEFSISIIISVFNEEGMLNNRIKNILDLEYDHSKIEVIIGSDGSTDNTNKILMELNKKYPWLHAYFFAERRGKGRVLNDLVNASRNEVLVFTDINTVFDKKAIRTLAQKFNQRNVGGISGRLILLEPNVDFERSIEEKKYWEYETYLKDCEGKNGILIGANGGIFALKRNLYKSIPTDKPITDDLYITLSVLDQNYRFLYEKAAIAYEVIAPKLIYEFRRKVRFAATNFQTLSYFKNFLLNKNLLLSYAFWSHKIIRWISPFLFLLLLISNIIVFNEAIQFKILLCLQLVFYFLAITGLFLRKFKHKIIVLSLPFYFVLTNVAVSIGFFKFIFKKHRGYWEPTPR